MWSRLTLIVLGLFWLTMVGLLCWSEFGGQRHLGTGASIETVWDKILTCPDASAMSVKLHGESIGYCQWRPDILEGGAKSTGADDAENLEGMYRIIAGYKITVGSSFSFPEDDARYRVSTVIEFSPDKEWQTFNFDLREGEQFLTVLTDSKHRSLEWSTVDGTSKLNYEQLQDPSKLLGPFGGPMAALAFSGMPALMRPGSVVGADSAVRWKADYSWIRILNQRVRCYELSTRVFDREIKVFVSLVGEILRVELPNGIELINTTETQM